MKGDIFHREGGWLDSEPEGKEIYRLTGWEWRGASGEPGRENRQGLPMKAGRRRRHQRISHPKYRKLLAIRCRYHARTTQFLSHIATSRLVQTLMRAPSAVATFTMLMTAAMILLTPFHELAGEYSARRSYQAHHEEQVNNSFTKYRRTDHKGQANRNKHPCHYPTRLLSKTLIICVPNS